MHYTGMAAYDVAGHKAWEPATVIVSLALGAVLGGAALAMGSGGRGMRRQLPGAFLLVLAICGHHFTAMVAVTITPDPSVLVSETAVPNSWLAVAVALASFAILLLAGAALGLDLRDRRQAEREADRLRSLANAAVEGLLVVPVTPSSVPTTASLASLACLRRGSPARRSRLSFPPRPRAWPLPASQSGRSRRSCGGRTAGWFRSRSSCRWSSMPVGRITPSPSAI